MKRVQTGVEHLDDMIEGGLKTGSVVLVSGGVGSGKTTLAFQFLYNGVKAGESGVYFTFEEDPQGIKEDMRRHGFDVEAEEQEGTFEIVRVNPEDALRLIDEDYGPIRDTLKRVGATRAVLDSVGAFELLVQDGYTMRRSISNLINWFRGVECTTLLVAEAEQSPNAYSRHGILEFLVDAVVVLYNIRRGNLRRRALEVLKMRGTKHETKIVSFIFSKGIQLLPKEDVFD